MRPSQAQVTENGAMSPKPYTRQSVIDAYQRLGSVRDACDETGCSPYVAVIWLSKAGVLKANERARYGCESSQRGAEAELEFQRLAPQAVCANSTVASNNPSFDFMVGETTVDVKSAIPRSDGRWGWTMPGNKALQPDFVVVFLANDKTGLQSGYRILLLPVALMPDSRSKALRPENDKSPLWDFEVQPEALAELLAESAEDAP